MEEILLGLNRTTRCLDYGKGLDLDTLKLTGIVPMDAGEEILNKLGIVPSGIQYICDPSVLPIGFPNSTLTAILMSGFASSNRQRFIRESFAYLLELFRPNRNTFIPDIVITMIYIKFLNGVGINAKYGSFVSRLSQSFEQRLTESFEQRLTEPFEQRLTESSDEMLKIIPFVNINGKYMNIYGISFDNRHNWADYYSQRNEIRDRLNEENVNIDHEEYCPCAIRRFEEKVQDLLANNLENCTCSVKQFKILLLDFYIRENTIDLNNLLRGISRPGKIPELLTLRYLFCGVPYSYRLLKRTFFKKVSIHLMSAFMQKN